MKCPMCSQDSEKENEYDKGFLIRDTSANVPAIGPYLLKCLSCGYVDSPKEFEEREKQTITADEVGEMPKGFLE